MRKPIVKTVEVSSIDTNALVPAFKNICRYRKRILVLAVLSICVLNGCSDDDTANAPGNEKRQANAPAVEVVQTGSGLENEGKQESEEIEQERPLRIGVIGPESGDEAHYGLSVLKGVLAAAGRFNTQGGLGGSKIEVVHYDNKSDPELTRAAVQNLIRQRVIAILAAPTGWATFAPTRMANSTRTLFISIGTRRRIGRSGPYVFRASLSDELATGELIRYALEELAYTSFAIVTSSSYDYSLDLSASFRHALVKHGGVLAVEADTYDTYLGKRNLDAVIDAIKGSPATLHGVIFTGAVDEAALLAAKLRKAGLNLPILGGEDLFAAEYLTSGEAVRGTLLYTTFAPDNESVKAVEFRRDYGEGRPDRFSALAYDVFMLLAEAIKIAGTTKATQVREALISIREFEGATGKTSFTSSGAPVKHPFIYSVKEGERGQRFVLSKQ
jgi:branched-chain amino acid transport system substrate-binding protein